MKDNPNMISIGIQNESGVLSASPKKKVKTKTIILMDAANQTGIIPARYRTSWNIPVIYLCRYI